MCQIPAVGSTVAPILASTSRPRSTGPAPLTVAGTGLWIMPGGRSDHRIASGTQPGHDEVTVVTHSSAGGLGTGDVDDRDHRVRDRPTVAGDHRAGQHPAAVLSSGHTGHCWPTWDDPA